MTQLGPLLDIEEAAAMCDVSTKTIHRWCSLCNGRRKLGNFKIGRRITISSIELSRVQHERRVSPQQNVG